jgi:hypothetical protein
VHSRAQAVVLAFQHELGEPSNLIDLPRVVSEARSSA